jgi:protein SCO1/2
MRWPTALLLSIALMIGQQPAHAGEAPPAADPLPGRSLYRLDVTLDPVGGPSTRLGAFAGRPVVITMFYSSCTVVCPVLTMSMQRLEAALVPADRERVRFVMVSLDDAHDTPEVLAAFATTHHLDPGRWTVARAGARNVRLLAAGLGIRYRRLPDGSFSHSSVITVLDAQGVATARSDDLGGTDPALLAALRAALQ